MLNNADRLLLTGECVSSDNKLHSNIKVLGLLKGIMAGWLFSFFREQGHYTSITHTLDSTPEHTGD